MRIRLTYSKLGKIRFLGHLDMARLWERSLRRVGVAVSMSAGFTPRPKLSFGLALPTGAESLIEIFDMVVDEPIEPAELPARLAPALPPGVAVTSAGEAGSQLLQEDVTATTWILAVSAPAVDVSERIDRLVGADECWIERERKGERRRDDVRPGVLDLGIVGEAPRATLPDEWTSAVAGSTLVEATLTTSGRGVRPTELVEILLPGVEPWSVMSRVIRTHQWIERSDAPCAPFSVRAGKDFRHERRLVVN